MLSFHFACVAVLSLLPLSHGIAPPVIRNIPHFKVDLEADPGNRWHDVLEDFLDSHGVSAFEETYIEWLASLAEDMPHHFGPSSVLESSNRLMDALSVGHPALVAELASLSSALKRRSNSSVFDLPMLASATSMYIILNIAPKNGTDARPHRVSACTSTLVVGAGGHVLHGRSLDYEPRTAMANTVADISFVRGGVTSYICTHPLVYPTALQWFTCVKPGSMSLSVNARSRGQWFEQNTTYEELLRRLSRPGKLLLGEAAAAAMETGSYSGALSVLASAPVVSSNYFILAGAEDHAGAIITRYGNHSSADVWALGSGGSDGQPSWMRVQTNVDHWVPLESGEYATHRRQHAINLLSAVGPGAVGESDLWLVYLTDTALDESSFANRTDPEDTGVILRPTTITTLVMSPANKTRGLGGRVWASDPEIQAPPAAGVVVFA